MRPSLLFALWFGLLLPPAALSAEDSGPILTHLGEETNRQDMRGRKLVVVYYSNDSEAPYHNNGALQNLELFQQKIEEASKDPQFSTDDREKLLAAARIVGRSHDEMTAQANKDLYQLNKSARREGYLVASVRNRGNSGLNYNIDPRGRLFRELEWTHGPYFDESGREFFHIESVRLPHDLGGNRFRYCPLSHPAVFGEVMRQIQTRFPAGEYCFLLIVRSAATRESMLTAVLTADVSAIDRIALARVVLQAVAGLDLAKANEEHVATLVNQAVVDAFVTPELAPRREQLEKDKNSYKVLAHQLPDYIPRVMESYEFGTTKEEWTRALRDLGLGEHPGLYPMIVLTAPRSRLEYSNEPDLQFVLKTAPGSYEGFQMRHVDWLFAQGEAAVNIGDVIEQSVRHAARDDSLDLVEAFRRNLADAAAHPVPANEQQTEP